MSDLMQTIIDIVLMTTNYSHDIATASLAVSGLMMWVLYRTSEKTEVSSGAERFFVGVYKGIRRMAVYSLAWIIAAGVPRVVTYDRYDWSDIAGDGQLTAVGVKHILMFLFVITGVYYWAKLDRTVKALQLKHTSQRRL